ncbi:GyrI-like domain-containing protein [Paenibacillus hexagrammi]|uniref:GyrI-like domain-containing protein n=1 Tax=Paenibacillus hexagrammi TaxID=2908839 RepID=A0ABY3SRH3_9BACL|nr:GyrI-like domain-containing protein [Paenibacillus sp. YPD9-1]UJF36289.1 GyrI-like domain-containing protein [Paenibacillus sp. YPD9-1]
MILETKIVEKAAFSVIGQAETIHFDPSLPPSENTISQLWKEFNGRCCEIEGQVGFRAYGLVLHKPGSNPNDPFAYTAAVQVSGEASPPTGMIRLEVPAARYAVVTLRGPLDEISQGFQYFWGQWLPASPYEYDGGTLTGKYEFEFYDQRCTTPDDPNSEIDLYFPVRGKVE